MKKHLRRAAAFFLAALILPLFAIPALAAEPQDCGNWLLHDLPMARWESRKY